MKFQVDDRVKLSVDFPDDNEDLYKGDEGYIIQIIKSTNLCLVFFDKKTEAANGNNHLIVDLFDPYARLSQEELELLEDKYENRLWFVQITQLKSVNKIKFRSKNRNETQQEYRIACKIAELDFEWKEKQNAKTRNLSI